MTNFEFLTKNVVALGSMLIRQSPIGDLYTSNRKAFNWSEFDIALKHEIEWLNSECDKEKLSNEYASNIVICNCDILENYWYLTNDGQTFDEYEQALKHQIEVLNSEYIEIEKENEDNRMMVQNKKQKKLKKQLKKAKKQLKKAKKQLKKAKKQLKKAKKSTEF